MSKNSNKMGDLKTNEMTARELKDEIKNISTELNAKIMENENYRQEVYELRHKLKACLATQKDLSDANDLMEENLTLQQIASEKKINNLSEKFSIEKKQLEERIFELQTNLLYAEQQNKKLKEALNAKERLLATRESENPDQTLENSNLKKKISCLITNLEQKETVEEELLFKQQILEETNAKLRKNYNEIHEILQVKKEDLKSVNEILETTKYELIICRSELESLKTVPASDSIKGNSLFAEVEDNRRKLMNDMTLLKKKFLHMKQTYDSKNNEITVLKADRAVLLRKLEDESVATIDQSARLIEAYKLRISELENELKIEKKKLNTKEKDKEQSGESNFSYLQSLLAAKKKEIKELTNKLEESSIQKILQEEIKYEIEKQLRQWRCKGMSYQAQLSAIKNQAKCDNCLKIQIENAEDANISVHREQLYYRLTDNVKSSLPEINDSETTMEKLLQIPGTSTNEWSKDLTEHSIGDDNDVDRSKENIQSVQLKDSTNAIETVSDFLDSLARKNSIYNEKSNRENRAHTSNANETIQKSDLAKSLCPEEVQDRTKKSLRFTTDTIDHEKPKLPRQKIEKKTYPVVFIQSNKSKK